MAALNFIITDAGRAAVAQAGSIGPVILQAIQIGDAGYTPSANQTSLVSPIKTIIPTGFSKPLPDTIHFTLLDESSSIYTIQEIGIFTSNNILFAVCSQTTPIITKSASSAVLLAFDLVMTGVPAGTVNVGDTGFSYPPASESTKGVAKIATQVLTQAGTDNETIVTPLRLRGYIIDKSQIPTQAIEFDRLSSDVDVTKNVSSRVARAWVNFAPWLLTVTTATTNANLSLSTTAGSDILRWTSSVDIWTDDYLGTRWRFPSVKTVTGGTVGGVNVSGTTGLLVTTYVSRREIRLKLPSPATITETIAGAATPTTTTGYTYIPTNTVRASFNVASVSRQAAGVYRITFSQAMADTFYAVAGSCKLDSTAVDSVGVGTVALRNTIGAQSLAYCDIRLGTSTAALDLSFSANVIFL